MIKTQCKTFKKKKRQKYFKCTYIIYLIFKHYFDIILYSVSRIIMVKYVYWLSIQSIIL